MSGVIFIFHISKFSYFINNSIKFSPNSKSKDILKFWGFQNCPYFRILPSRSWNKGVRSPFNFFLTGVFNLNYLSFYLDKKIRTVLKSWKHSDIKQESFFGKHIYFWKWCINYPKIHFIKLRKKWQFWNQGLRASEGELQDKF